MRSVFYPSGTSYFGYTQDNNGNWSNAAGGNCTTYFKIAATDLNSGTWSGSLKIKPDIGSSYYNGPGEYLFKVGRYTPSCNSASVWSQESTIAITGPTPTPTSNPTSVSTPTPTATATPKPTVTPTPILKLSPTDITDIASTDEEILGVSSDSADTQTPTPESKEIELASKTNNNLLPKMLIFIGIVFLVACAIVIFYPYIKDKIKKNTNE